MNFNPFGKKEKVNSLEVEKERKIKEVLSFIKELANDAVFERDGRKKYHVDGTQPVNLIDRISRPFLGLSGPESINRARLELLDILQRVLNKAEEIKSEDIEKIRKVIDLLNDPDIFTNSQITNKIASEIDLMNVQPQVTVNRNEDKTKIIEKQDYWEKPDPSLN